MVLNRSMEAYGGITDPTEPAVLEVCDLRVAFPSRTGHTEVVHGVSFALPQGRTLGLVGESGSGKTVTSLALMGLLPSNARISGSVALEGRQLIGASSKQLRALRGSRIAMIFQDPAAALNPVLTIGLQITEILREHTSMAKDQCRERAAELLMQVDLPRPRALLDAYPHELSGGMKQRVVIAMAIALDPAVLIADEPTTALDVTVQREILSLLHDLQRRMGMAMLFITHDLAVVADICDDVAVMFAGEIVEYTDVIQTFERPSHPYTAELLSSTSGHPLARVHRRTATTPAGPPAVRHEVGCSFRGRCPFEISDCTGRLVPLVDRPGRSAVRCLNADFVAERIGALIAAEVDA